MFTSCFGGMQMGDKLYSATSTSLVAVKARERPPFVLAGGKKPIEGKMSTAVVLVES